MSSLTIAIPSRGRASSQTTVAALPKALLKDTVVVVPAEEFAAYKKEVGKLVTVVRQGKNVTNIAQKRGWICKNLCDSKLLMLDDDLNFEVRYTPDGRPTREMGEGVRLLRAREESHVLDGIQRLSTNLDKFIHGGLGSRLFNNRQPAFVTTTRCMHALAYTKEACKLIKWGSVNLKEDFDATLQLLRKGYDNFLIHDVVVSPLAYGAPGGCTDEREVSGHDLSSMDLVKAHPEFVRVVSKNYKGVPRQEVVVSWKRALQSGRTK